MGVAMSRATSMPTLEPGDVDEPVLKKARIGSQPTSSAAGVVEDSTTAGADTDVAADWQCGPYLWRVGAVQGLSLPDAFHQSELPCYTQRQVSAGQMPGAAAAGALPAQALVMRWAEAKQPTTSVVDFVSNALRLLYYATGGAGGRIPKNGFCRLQLGEKELSHLEAIHPGQQYRDAVVRWFQSQGRDVNVPYVRNVDLGQRFPGCPLMRTLCELPHVGLEARENLLRVHWDRECTGIVVPWLYLGSTGSAFGLHLEDCCLDGVNVMLPLQCEEGDDISKEDARLLRLFNRLSFKRWWVYQGSDEQLMALQAAADSALGKGRGLSLETINQRLLMVLPPPMATQQAAAVSATAEVAEGAASNASTKEREERGAAPGATTEVAEGAAAEAAGAVGVAAAAAPAVGSDGSGGSGGSGRGGFVAVDQVPGTMVVVHQAHFGCGMGGCNVSWNACSAERLLGAAHFLAEHHRRVRAGALLGEDGLGQAKDKADVGEGGDKADAGEAGDKGSEGEVVQVEDVRSLKRLLAQLAGRSANLRPSFQLARFMDAVLRTDQQSRPRLLDDATAGRVRQLLQQVFANPPPQGVLEQLRQWPLDEVEQHMLDTQFYCDVCFKELYHHCISMYRPPAQQRKRKQTKAANAAAAVAKASSSAVAAAAAAAPDAAAQGEGKRAGSSTGGNLPQQQQQQEGKVAGSGGGGLPQQQQQQQGGVDEKLGEHVADLCGECTGVILERCGLARCMPSLRTQYILFTGVDLKLREESREAVAAAN